MDIYSLAYNIEYDGPRGPEKATVPAFRVLQWLRVPDALAGNYFNRMYPNVKLVGDNSKGFGTSKWNPAEFSEYSNPVRPEDAKIIVDYDEKKNWYFTMGPRIVETPNKQEQAKPSPKLKLKRQGDAAEDEN